MRNFRVSPIYHGTFQFPTQHHTIYEILGHSYNALSRCAHSMKFSMLLYNLLCLHTVNTVGTVFSFSRIHTEITAGTIIIFITESAIFTVKTNFIMKDKTTTKNIIVSSSLIECSVFFCCVLYIVTHVLYILYVFTMVTKAAIFTVSEIAA